MAKLLLTVESRRQDRMSIGAFCDEVQRDPGYFAGSRVVKLVHYKRPGHVEHEFLVMDVLHSGTMRQLCLERGREKSEHWWHLASSLTPATNQISRWIPNSREDPTKPNVKGGRGTRIRGTDDPNGAEKDRLLEIYIVRSPETFALADICLVLRLVPEMALNYDVKRYQCYWFCWVLLELVQEELEAIGTKGREFQRGGMWRNQLVLDKVGARERLTKYRAETGKELQTESKEPKRNIFLEATKAPAAYGSQMGQVAALFSHHQESQERETQAREKELERVTRRVREEAKWDAALARMSPVSRAFAMMARQNDVESGLGSASRKREVDQSWAI